MLKKPEPTTRVVTGLGKTHHKKMTLGIPPQPFPKTTGQPIVRDGPTKAGGGRGPRFDPTGGGRRAQQKSCDSGVKKMKKSNPAPYTRNRYGGALCVKGCWSMAWGPTKGICVSGGGAKNCFAHKPWESKTGKKLIQWGSPAPNFTHLKQKKKGKTKIDCIETPLKTNGPLAGDGTAWKKKT